MYSNVPNYQMQHYIITQRLDLHTKTHQKQPVSDKNTTEPTFCCSLNASPRALPIFQGVRWKSYRPDPRLQCFAAARKLLTLIMRDVELMGWRRGRFTFLNTAVGQNSAPSVVQIRGFVPAPAIRTRM